MKSILTIACLPLFMITISFQAPPDTLWTKVFGNGWEGGGCFQGDAGTSVVETYDGGYAVTGWLAQESGNSKLWLLRVDEQGDTLWTKSYSGDLIDRESAGYCIQETSDSGYVIAGTKNFDSWNNCLPWILRLDKNGDTLWTKSYLGNHHIFQCVRETADGGYILSGKLETAPSPCKGSRADHGIEILRLNEYGDSVWCNSYKRERGVDGWAVNETIDGGFIYTGSTVDTQDVIRLDEFGNTIWEKRFSDSIICQGKSLQLTDDGGCVIAGKKTDGDYVNIVLLRLNEGGDIIGNTVYDLVGNQEVYCIRKLNDNGFIIAGYTELNGNKDVIITRTNVLGEILWMKSIDRSINDCAHSIEQITDGGYIITGITLNSQDPTDKDLWLIRLESDKLTSTESGFAGVTTFKLYQNYPNPFNPVTTIKYAVPNESRIVLKIYDVLGNEILTLLDEIKPAGEYVTRFDGGKLSSGIYFSNLQAGEFEETKKMLLLK